MEKNTDILKRITEQLLDLMKVSAEVAVSYDKNDEVFVVAVDAGEATGLLIGKRGETLLSIQNILGVLYKQEIGEWGKIVLNVGDYRQKEEEYLKTLAENTAQRAVETGNPQNLYSLKAWQRRIIHMFLSEKKEVTTTSEGEGEDRYLIVSPKK